MNKIGLLLVLVTASFILLASTCVKHTPYPYKGPVPIKKGLLSIKVNQALTGKSASQAIAAVFWTADSAGKHLVVPGTKSIYTCDTSGTVVFDSLMPRKYSVAAIYYSGKDTLKGEADTLTVVSNAKKSYIMTVKK